MPSNRRKQFNPTKSVYNIETDDKAGTSSGTQGDESKEVDFREVILRRGTGFFIKNFIYIKNRECHGKIFLRCQHRTSCSAKAYIKISNKRAVITQSYHPHPPPNHKTIQFKSPPVTRKKKRPLASRRRKSRRVPTRKVAAVKVKEEFKVKVEKEEPVEVKSEVQSSDETEEKPSPLPLRERSQRTRKLPARLREDPSPIPPSKKRKKKKVLFIAPPKKKKKVAPIVTKREPVELDDLISDSSDSSSEEELEEMDDKTVDMSPSSPTAKSPSKSKDKVLGKQMPKGKSIKTTVMTGGAGSPKKKEHRSALEVLRQLTDAALESDPEEDDDLLVSSDDEEGGAAKVLDRKETKQRTILDVDQLRKLSATALVLKFSRHTTSKVPKDLTTFTYQHQYACTMLPGICSEKFCGNAGDTKPQIKRHLLRHIGELLTMTNQVSPATSFPGSVQSQAKRRMPTTEEIEEIEDAESSQSQEEGAGSSQEATADVDDAAVADNIDDDAETEDSGPLKIKTRSYLVPTSHQPNKAHHVALPKDVNVRRSSFTVIRSAEGVNEVVLLPKGRLINLSTMQALEEEEGLEQYNKDENPEKSLERARKREKKKKAYYPNYKRKKGLSKTRAWHMRQSAVRLEIVDDFDEDIDIEDTGDDDDDDSSTGSHHGDDIPDAEDDEKEVEQRKDGRGGTVDKIETPEEKIETEEVSLSGAFQSPESDQESPSRNIIPSTSQEIECDIIVRTRKHNINKKPTLPRSVGQSLKSASQLNQMARAALANPGNIVVDPPGDDHNYAWHPTRYIDGPTHTDSRGNSLDKPEEKVETESEKFDLDPIFYPFQSPQGVVVDKKSVKQPRTLVRMMQGVGKVASGAIEASNPRWVKVPARDKREPTDEEKKIKKKALELLNALHKKQPFKGRKGPFKCQLCGKNVTAAGTLRAHYRSHAGIKPYRCKLCGATFTRLHSLKYHMMIHNQQSRFVCDHCSREFRHASHFREHLRRHTGEEPFGCTDCPARFKTRNTYKRHLFAKHGKLLTAEGIQLVPNT